MAEYESRVIRRFEGSQGSEPLGARLSAGSSAGQGRMAARLAAFLDRAALAATRSHTCEVGIAGGESGSGGDAAHLPPYPPPYLQLPALPPHQPPPVAFDCFASLIFVLVGNEGSAAQVLHDFSAHPSSAFIWVRAPSSPLIILS